MKRFVEGEDRTQSTLFPERLDDYICEDNPVRVVEAFVDELELGTLGFDGVELEVTGRPAYHPATLLKIYIYGYLNRIQSSRRLEREAQRNVELIWLTGRLMPDFKTIADFRKENGKAIRSVCREFVVLCRNLKLFSEAIVIEPLRALSFPNVEWPWSHPDATNDSSHLTLVDGLGWKDYSARTGLPPSGPPSGR